MTPEACAVPAQAPSAAPAAAAAKGVSDGDRDASIIALTSTGVKLPPGVGLQHLSAVTLRLGYVGRAGGPNSAVATFTPTLNIRCSCSDHMVAPLEAPPAGWLGPAAGPSSPGALVVETAPWEPLVRNDRSRHALPPVAVAANDSAPLGSTLGNEEVAVVAGAQAPTQPHSGVDVEVVTVSHEHIHDATPAVGSTPSGNLSQWEVTHTEEGAADGAGPYQLQGIVVEGFDAAAHTLALRFDKRYPSAGYAVAYRLCLQRVPGTGDVVAFGRWRLVGPGGALSDDGVVSGVGSAYRLLLRQPEDTLLSDPGPATAV